MPNLSANPDDDKTSADAGQSSPPRTRRRRPRKTAPASPPQDTAAQPNDSRRETATPPDPSPQESAALGGTPGSSEATGADKTGDQTQPDWPDFLRTAPVAEVEERFKREAKQIIAASSAVADRYAIVALIQPEESITQFELDQIFEALARQNPNRAKDVMLILLSPGGSIEPAYQISKLCKAAAKDRFIVCIPRQVKSAATLIALGADEIHMGFLGQLGPIDPQVQGLPALGVSQALETLASLVERHPSSAPMFASYLQNAVRIEQIGYYERICASAVQYGERLLSTKQSLPKPAAEIARELVHEYKDHGFVIDIEEAIDHLGADWIKTSGAEASVAERIYRLFETVNLFLGHYRGKKLWVAGSFDDGVYIFDRPKRRGA